MIDNFKTLAGLTLAEAATRLDAELPKDAYKAVPGAADLTDIDPNYMRKTFNEVFGMCGIGWGYRYDAHDLRVEIENRPRSSGGTRKVHMATLLRLIFWYKLADAQGAETLCEIEASGGSENDVEAYAMKGAITNALGNAASNIGFQESVYLGKRSHKTVGGGKSSPAPKPAPAKTEVPVAEAKTSAEFMVSIGKRAGKTLSEIYAEGEEGAKAIQFYTTMATGGNAGKEALRNAAISFLAQHNGHIPQSVAA
ncbi:MAG: hypothetical protein HYR93_07080 [Chloroflexi bacterium]|nr:hypothetical protein [Chloroflexota bacterium]MBI3340786.1 hypothetical protein [Chloroflexota bacterium]